MKVSVRIPRKVEILFFGNTGLNLLRYYITERRFDIYESPKKTLNLWVLLRSLASGFPTFLNYYHAYLRFARPRFVVTREDNAREFYATKALRPSCITLCIQNGLRSRHSTTKSTSFIESIDKDSRIKYEVDVVATFGPNSSLFFAQSKHLKVTHFAEIGSLKNNSIEIVESAQVPASKRIVFISTFPNLGPGGSRSNWNTSLAGYWGEAALTLDSYYRSEALVASIASDFAERVGCEFVVLGKRPSWQVGERRFFSEVLIGRTWKFIPQSTEVSSYESVTKLDTIVNIDSTLGYELFARGYRVAFAACRMSHAGYPEIPDTRFGFPMIAEAAGDYWTDSDSRSEIERIIRAVHSIEHKDWAARTYPERLNIMRFDPSNTLFCEILDNLGIPNRGPGFIDRSQIRIK